MTVKELKHMLENAEDNAIVVVRNNWAPAEFLNTSARKKELAKEYPDAVKITRDEGWCMEADMPKEWVKIKPPRKLTEEQYAELVRRGKELAERQRQAKNLVKE